MKKFFLPLLSATLLLCFLTTSSAQVRFGIKAGLNLANVTGDTELLGDENKMLMTFLIGGQAEFGINENLGVGVGLQASGKGVKIDAEGDPKISPIYLQVPVQLFYRNSGFFVGVGPYVGFGIAGKWDDGTDSESLNFGNGEDDDLAPLDFGAGLEAGYEFGSLRATASYNLGLSNVLPKDVADILDASLKNAVIGVALAYMFGGAE